MLCLMTGIVSLCSTATAQDAASKPAIELLRPKLGVTYTEDGDEVLWFAVRARVVNSTDAALTIPLDAWRLQVEKTSLKPLADPFDSLPGAISDLDLDGLFDSSVPALAKLGVLKLPVGGEGEALLIFSGLPLGGRLPQLKLTLQRQDTEPQTIDVNAEFKRRLTIKRAI
jgi:hypothetical protein